MRVCVYVCDEFVCARDFLEWSLCVFGFDILCVRVYVCVCVYDLCVYSCMYVCDVTHSHV